MRSVFILFFISAFSLSCSKEKAHKKSVEGYYYNYFKTYEPIYGQVSQIKEFTSGIISQRGDSVFTKPLYSTVYKYDKENNETHIAGYINDKLHWRVSNSYNDHGSLTKIDYYNDDDELRYSSVFSYDSKGYATGFTDHTAKDGSLIAEETFTNDENGKLIQETHYSVRNNQRNSIAIHYDDSARIAEQRYYDMNGRCTEWNIFTYDTHGNIKEQTVYNSDSSIYVRYYFKYSGYDKYGNWMKRFDYENDTPVRKTERVYEYQ